MKKTTFVLLSALLLTGCSKTEEPVEKEVKLVQTTPEKTVQMAPEEPKFVSTVTGVSYDEEKTYNNYGVMVENTPAARPQSGLVDADIVFEVETEAQITRFFALFHDETPKIVGPARSARHYFIPLAEQLNAVYIHFGGSPQAYTKLKTFKPKSVDGITQGSYFTRDNTRKAPHNAYLHPDRLPTFESEVKNDMFAFGKNEYESQKDVKEMGIHYNNFTDVLYKYDEKTKVYQRFLEEEKHEDRETKEQIAPTNVIVLFANHSATGDSSGRIDVDLTSGGEARYYTHGKEVTGTWITQNNGIVFLNEYGKKVELSPGKTWIQVVRTGKEIIAK